MAEVIGIGVNGNGTETRIAFEDDKMYAMDVQDVQPILDENSELRNAIQNPRSEFRHVARIPITVWTEWRKEYARTAKQDMPWQTFVASKLNNRDFFKFRTHESKV